MSIANVFKAVAAVAAVATLGYGFHRALTHKARATKAVAEVKASFAAHDAVIAQAEELIAEANAVHAAKAAPQPTVDLMKVITDPVSFNLDSIRLRLDVEARELIASPEFEKFMLDAGAPLVLDGTPPDGPRIVDVSGNVITANFKK